MRTPAPPRGTVLLVDDDAAVRRALGRLIRAAGYDVELFADARVCLSAAARIVRPACIVVDIWMLPMNGLELARAVSTAEGALPVVLITGDADMASQACAAEAGALEVLLKPIDEDMLITVIQRALFECRWTCGAWLSLMTKRRPGYWLKSGSALMSLGKLFAAARAVTRVPSRSARRKPTCSLRNDHT